MLDEFLEMTKEVLNVRITFFVTLNFVLNSIKTVRYIRDITGAF